MAYTQTQLADQQRKLGAYLNINGMDANKYGGYGSAIAAAGTLYGNAANNANWSDNINLNASGQNMDENGKPMLNTAQLQQSIDSLHGNNVVGASTLSAAGTGAAAGTAIMPGIGTLIGGAVGAISDVVGNILGNDKAKKRRRLAEQNLAQAQKIYNTNLSQYNNQFLSQQDYLDKANNSSRTYNLYKYNTPGNI